MTLYLILFISGFLTILLPCILPLIPIVLGVSIAGRSPLRPLFTVAGMVVSFVGFTFLLLVVLRQFVEFADYLRLGTYDVLLLFGLGFLTGNKLVQWVGAALGGFFFLSKGIPSVVVAAVLGILAMKVGGTVATRIQQFGSTVQSKAREQLGEDQPLTAFIVGLTMGLVWVPCAGPALGFAFTLVREQPGPNALVALTAYGLGTAVPLLAVGYGGQAAVRSVRSINKYSGRVKQVAGAILIATALAFQFRWMETLQTWFIENTGYGTLGTRIEERLFGETSAIDPSALEEQNTSLTRPNPQSRITDPKPESMSLPQLPKIVRAPEFAGLGPWHNSEPFTLESLRASHGDRDRRGKVVLVDFWTYSCINCIRTLPYIQGYWEKFGSAKLPAGEPAFMLLGVHTPEFVFEKSEANVADAIKRHGLTYPIAQDNDYGTWRAFSNRYWPAKYLIDAEGYIRYTHFGEGAYEETELAIRSLLAEIGVSLDSPSDPDIVRAGARDDTPPQEQRQAYRERSPETYLGERSWPSLGNGGLLPTDEVVTYAAPSALKLHSYYLVGDWQMVNEERQVLRSDKGEIRMRFLGGEINLVMGMDPTSSASGGLRGASAAPATVDVEVDGEHDKSFTIDKQDLFELWTGDYGEHDIVLRIHGEGAAGYAFTFGS